MTNISLDDFEIIPKMDKAYAIGLADKHVTIKSQQIRAVSLAHLMHSKFSSQNEKLAIIGGGISGLTLAAKLFILG